MDWHCFCLFITSNTIGQHNFQTHTEYSKSHFFRRTDMYHTNGKITFSKPTQILLPLNVISNLQTAPKYNVYWNLHKTQQTCSKILNFKFACKNDQVILV